MKQENVDISITPETKLGALLDAFPELEPVLMEMSPRYKKLRSPVLRKTVAKVATLHQVAKIGNIPVKNLINRLRQEVGLENLAVEEEKTPGISSLPPDWVQNFPIELILDARPILEKGEQPIQKVLEELKTLEKNKTYLLVTPFLPGPLLDMVKKKGYRVWSTEEKEDTVKTYISHSP